MKKKILASILAVTTLATCAFSAVACNKEVPKDEVSSSAVEEVKEEGKLVVNDVTTTPGMRLNVVRRLRTTRMGPWQSRKMNTHSRQRSCLKTRQIRR